jgi:glyoxylase-like metal-dependent hydrolase (beta-lactamase superfamily II)
MKRVIGLFAIAVAGAAGLVLAQQAAPPAELHVLPVQNNIYMLVGAGGNITLQIGKQGVLMVDSGLAANSAAVYAEVKKLTNLPVRYIINTHVHPDHVGGNEGLAKLIPPNRAQPLAIIANENVLNRMIHPANGAPQQFGQPTDEYYLPFKALHYNGEAVIIYHELNAHTDGDSVVLFRGSDVISTGDIFTPGAYPFIDVAQGGSVDGELKALTHILDMSVPAVTEEGGTLIIPGHGRLCEETDVAEFRDMMAIVRDRIQDGIKKGKTLAQIKADKPTLDYDTEYYRQGAFVTPDAFVEAVYKSLNGGK